MSNKRVPLRAAGQTYFKDRHGTVFFMCVSCKKKKQKHSYNPMQRCKYNDFKVCRSCTHKYHKENTGISLKDFKETHKNTEEYKSLSEFTQCKLIHETNMLIHEIRQEMKPEDYDI